MKDPVQAPLPSDDRIFVALRVEGSRDHIPLTLLDDLPMDLANGPAIETSGKRTIQRAHSFIQLT